MVAESMSDDVRGASSSFYAGLSQDAGDVYRREVVRFVPGYEEMQQVMRSEARKYFLAHPQRSYAIADLGCGPGNTGASLIRESGGRGIYYFLDKEKGMIDSAQKTASIASANFGEADIRYVHGDIESFSPDAPLDIAVSSLVLHNITDPLEKEDAIQRIFYSLKDGGVFIWSDFALLDNPLDHEEAVAERVKTAWDRGADPDFITQTFEKEGRTDNPQKVSEMKRLLEDTGFSEVREVWKGTSFVTFVAKK